MRSFLTIPLVAATMAASLLAQDVAPTPDDAVVADSINIANTQSTTIELGYWGVKGTVAPGPYVPATSISPETKLVLRLSDQLGATSNIKWFHNGTQIATDSTELTIASASKADSGFYWATFDGTNPEIPSTSSLQIIVARADHHRLANMSVRATITPDAPRATFGWVVGQPGANPHAYGTYLIRVIGPSLAGLNVPHALADPVVHFYNAAGEELNWAHVMIWDANYIPWLRTVTTSVGAFPIELPSATEFVEFVSLPTGAVTAVVSSASGGSGDVLFELYEVLEPPPYPEPYLAIPPPDIVVPPSD